MPKVEYKQVSTVATGSRHLGTCKQNESLNVVLVVVCGVQRVKVGLTRWTRIDQRFPSPCKSGSAKLHRQNACNESGVPAIAVWECVDLSDNLMMKPDSNFVDGKCLMLDPESYVSQ